MLAWQPTASLKNLQIRAEVLAKIRTFFAERGVMEVETPLLSHATVTDLHLQSFITQYQISDKQQEKLYLQTSPEFAMKRLLAAGSGAIYQICKAFRNGGEFGRLHNPEFTMLEWYRPGFNHHNLMRETEELLHAILNTAPAEYFTYAELFAKFININSHQASLAELKNCAQQLCGDQFDCINSVNRDDWLQLLMGHIIEPQLGKDKPTFVYNFPASQAALARLSPTNSLEAERFEVYVSGLELANGYHELIDSVEQRQRFQADLAKRQALGYPIMPTDERLLAALEQGIPACAGIALGIDRLVMLAVKAENLAEVLSFTIKNA